MLDNVSFAAFVMTYERASILNNTIDYLLQQTFPPQKIVVVDNSTSFDTMNMLKERADQRIEYHRVGRNAGPSGAAKIGLEQLTLQGYKWIYWGDDDDPPVLNDCFERALKCAISYPGNCGVVGAVGQRLNRKTGVIERVCTEEIQSSKYIDVDNVAGGVCKIVNAEVVKLHVLPEEKLFFGFEELAFDLKVKKAGYSIIVDSSLFIEYRTRSGRLDYKREYGQFVDSSKLWREYYSIRNGLHVYKTNKMYSAIAATIARKIAKSVSLYKYGMKYGNKYISIFSIAVWHWIIGKYGKWDKRP